VPSDRRPAAGRGPSRVSERVDGRSGGEGAARRGTPLQDAGFGLFQPPSFGPLTPMMVSTQRRDVTGTGESAQVPGGGVVQVGSGSGPPAAGGRTSGVTGVDQVAEGAAGSVGTLSLGVIARVADHRDEVRLSVRRNCAADWPADQQCWPVAQAWAAAVPSGCRAVTHSGSLGSGTQAATRARASSAPTRPNPSASPHAPGPPSQAARGTVMVTCAAGTVRGQGRSRAAGGQRRQGAGYPA
jgi:hypothetical protein